MIHGNAFGRGFIASTVKALHLDGGLVPKGNPDGMSGRGNKRWTTYAFDEFKMNCK